MATTISLKGSEKLWRLLPNLLGLPDDISADQAEVELPTKEPKDEDVTPEKEDE